MYAEVIINNNAKALGKNNWLTPHSPKGTILPKSFAKIGKPNNSNS